MKRLHYVWTITFAVLVNYCEQAHTFAPSKCKNYTNFDVYSESRQIFVLNETEICEPTNIPNYTHNYYEFWHISEECVISMSDMLNLMQLLGEAQDAIKPPESFYAQLRTQRYRDECSEYVPVSQKVSITDTSEECKELIDGMKDLIKTIRNKTEELINYLVEQNGDCFIEISKLNETVLVLNRQICQLKREHNEAMDEIYLQLLDQEKCFVAAFLDRQNQILELKAEIDKERTSVISSKVRAGKFAEGLTDFHCLNDNSLLESIITQAYDISSIAYVGQFASMLSSNLQRMTVYNTTFMRIKDNGDLVALPITIFRKVLREERAQDMPAFPELLANVTRYANNLINTWSNCIISQNISATRAIINMGSPPRESYTGRAFTEILAELLLAIYRTTSGDLKLLVEFVMALRWNIHKYTAYTAMYKMFSSREDKLQILLRLRDAMDEMSGPDPNPEMIRSNFEEFKSKEVPINMKSVVWNQKCRIRNRVDGYKYIRSGDIGYNKDFIDRPVATAASTDGERTNWRILAFLEKGEYQFRIQNSGSGEFLGSHSMWKEYSGSAGECSTNTATPCYDWRHFSWKIHFDGSSDEEILFYHVGRKGYMFSDSGVLLIYLFENRIASSGYWKIECNT